MVRRIFTVAALLSLLLCIVFFIIFIMKNFKGATNHFVAADVSGGRIYYHSYAIRTYGWPKAGYVVFSDANRTNSTWVGGGLAVDGIVVVLWMGIAGAAIRGLRTRPFGASDCACGYNLSGNTSSVCPECGVKIQIQRPMFSN